MGSSHKFAKALKMTIFLTILTKYFNLKFLFCSQDKIKNFESYKKYFSIVNLVDVSIELYSNKIKY